MWCVIRDYDGDISYSKIFTDRCLAISYAEHLRCLLNFRWKVFIVTVSFSSVEIVNKVINGKRAALQLR